MTRISMLITLDLVILNFFRICCLAAVAAVKEDVQARITDVHGQDIEVWKMFSPCIINQLSLNSQDDTDQTSYRIWESIKDTLTRKAKMLKPEETGRRIFPLKIRKAKELFGLFFWFSW